MSADVIAAARGTLRDLDALLVRHRNDTEAAAAVAWLDAAYADLADETRDSHRHVYRAAPTWASPGTPGRQRHDAWLNISRGSNYRRELISLAYPPSDSEAVSDDAASWPDPEFSHQLDEDDDFADGMTPGERAHRRDQEARDRLRVAAQQAPQRPRYDRCGDVPPSIDFTYTGGGQLIEVDGEPVTVDLERTLIEATRDEALGITSCRLSEDNGRTWREISYPEFSAIARALHAAAPTPPHPPAPPGWGTPPLHDWSRRVVEGVERAYREQAELEQALTRLRALTADGITDEEMLRLHYLFTEVPEPTRSAAFRALLEFVAAGHRINWSVLVPADVYPPAAGGSFLTNFALPS